MDLYETVARLRELNGKKPVKALFLANKVSIVNPYFIYFNCIPKNDERFTVAKNGNIVIEMFTDKEFTVEYVIASVLSSLGQASISSTKFITFLL